MTRRELMRKRQGFEGSNQDECQGDWPISYPLKFSSCRAVSYYRSFAKIVISITQELGA